MTVQIGERLCVPKSESLKKLYEQIADFAQTITHPSHIWSVTLICHHTFANFCPNSECCFLLSWWDISHYSAADNKVWLLPKAALITYSTRFRVKFVKVEVEELILFHPPNFLFQYTDWQDSVDRIPSGVFMTNCSCWAVFQERVYLAEMPKWHTESLWQYPWHRTGHRDGTWLLTACSSTTNNSMSHADANLASTMYGLLIIYQCHLAMRPMMKVHGLNSMANFNLSRIPSVYSMQKA